MLTAPGKTPLRARRLCAHLTAARPSAFSEPFFFRGLHRRTSLAYISDVNAPLYNATILRLAATIPYHERLPDPMATSEKRSPVCGSRVTVDIDLDDDGRVRAIGLLVRACALGQAAASLLAADVVGKSPEQLTASRDALTAWLAGEAEAMPEWPGLDIFTPALPHSARHASIRLAFEAAAEAAADARANTVAS